MSEKVEWIGLSFVRRASDVRFLKKKIAKKNLPHKVIAKIEKPEALACIDEIVQVCDGIMVARGDLGVEIPYQNVPLTQKMLINKGIQYAKPVIVATQMMESMITQMTPTRAEVNDVANAVLDGADAVMLSGETSVGNYPVEVINAMSKIIKEMELDEKIYSKEQPAQKNQERFISDSICYNACRLAQRVEVDAIITMSFSGYTAYKIASQRPRAGIYIFTSNRKILTQLNLVWGVRAFYYNKQISTDHTISDIKDFMISEGYLKTGDLFINIASIPLEDLGSSNMLKLSQVDLSDKIYASLLTAILIAPPILCPTDKYHLSFLGLGLIPDELQSKTSFLCVPLSSPLDIKLILLLLIDFSALIIEWLPLTFPGSKSGPIKTKSLYINSFLQTPYPSSKNFSSDSL